MTNYELYPETEPFNTGMLPVSDLHTLYYEEVGQPDGAPILYLHGGPGAGSGPKARQYFDPSFYRAVLYDQRGCGKSTPHAELRENTTWDLVEDIEKLRVHLGIDKWVVFGGSWGSTLAVAYAVTHPEHVLGLILRGIFLGRPFEVDWFYNGGTGLYYPEAYEKFLAVIPEDERDDMVTSYYKRLTSEDPAVRLEAAKAWSVWEGSVSQLIPDTENLDEFEDPEFALAVARIECHYFTNHLFLEDENELLTKSYDLESIPATIVQGRYDMLCPPVSAWQLKEAMPHAELYMVPDAGHATREPGILHRLLEATEKYKKLY